MEIKKKNLTVNDRTVDISDDYAVDYWTSELKTTKSKLLAAVNEVGDSYLDVKRQLKR